MDIACITKRELVPRESRNGPILSITQGLVGVLINVPLTHRRVHICGGKFWINIFAFNVRHTQRTEQKSPWEAVVTCFGAHGIVTSWFLKAFLGNPSSQSGSGQKKTLGQIILSKAAYKSLPWETHESHVTWTYSLNLFDDRILGITSTKICRKNIQENSFFEMFVYTWFHHGTWNGNETGNGTCYTLRFIGLDWLASATRNQ